MKTQRMILAALCGVAMLIGTSSCKKEKQENENEGEMMRIEVSVGGTDGNTKTHLLHHGNKYKVAWDNTDAFMLYTIDGTNGSSFRFSELVDDDDVTTAIFEGRRPGAAPFYGCYPSGKVSCEDGVYKFTIDETQAGNPETVDEQTATANAGPMVGYMKDAESGLVFQNPMSWLKVGLKGNVTIKRVTLTDKDGKKLNGTLKVRNLSVGTDGKLSFDTEMTGGTNKLVIVSNEGFQLKSTAPTYFWFQVPAGSLKKLELDAYVDVDGLTKVLELSKTISGGVVGNTVLTAEVNSSITATEAEVTTAVGCSDEYISLLKVTVKGKDPNFTTYKVGVCYNYADSEDPTIGHCIGYKEIGTFPIAKGSTKNINYDFDRLDLEDNKRYKICVYATNGIYAYSTECVEIDTGDVPQDMTWTGGKSPELFTVADPTPANPNSGDETKVRFSQGNLQYIGSAATRYWKFADHQFDFIGKGQNGSTANNIDRDLFGWGTSNNKPTGDSYYRFYQPWATSTDVIDETHTINTCGYGPSMDRPHPTGGVDERNLLVSKGSDWGANTISNGGSNSWRTLTMDEWVYLLSTRKDGSGELLYGEGKVGGCIPGLIILPDDWKWEGDVVGFEASWEPGQSPWSNVYSYSEWAKMEAAGAVFLPAACSRVGTSVYNFGSGFYWSSSYRNANSSWRLNFQSNKVILDNSGNRPIGFSVRLVTNAN